MRRTQRTTALALPFSFVLGPPWPEPAPTMLDLPSRSAAWNDPHLRPDQNLIDRAVAATLEHPLAVQARNHLYCHAVVLLEPKSFLAGTRSSVLTDALVSLVDCEHVLLVSYKTSEVRPEPLSGRGTTFDFVLHPNTLAILAAAKGYWVS